MVQTLVGRIAIVIPTYNSSTTVAETLKSLVDQGEHLRHVAAIYVADDCSSDNTPGIVRATWNCAVPLKILESNRNRGERSNVNRTVELIRDRADWILLLHSDDVAKENWLELMLERVNACSDCVASICSSWDNWLPDGTIIPGEDDPNRRIEVIRGDVSTVRGTLTRGCWWHVSGCAIRIKAFRDIGGFSPSLPQLGDWEWLLRCLARGWSVEYVPRTLIRYRQRTSSVSSKSFSMDRDIRESLAIIARYSHFFSSAELFFWHARRSWFCLRRLGRAITRLDSARFSTGLGTIALLFQTYFRLRKIPEGG